MRARFIPLAFLVVSLVVGVMSPSVAIAACSSSGVPALETDQHDYHPSIPVVFLASGLGCGATYSISITRPDGSTFSLTLVADDTGSGTATTEFDGQEGDYLAELRDGANATVATAVYHGSHFRYGHLTWRTIGFRTAEFVLTNAFRRSGYCAIGVTPCTRPSVGHFFLETVGATRLFFGDGGVTGTLIYETVAFNVAEDWVIGRAVVSATNRANITRTYALNGPFTAQIDSAARIGSLRNANSGYRVQTVVRFDIVNASPVSGLPPIVNAPINVPTFNFLLPAVDADGDTLSFRLATTAESAITNPIGSAGGTDAPNALTVNAATGLVSWNTTGTLVNQLYTTQIVIAESRGGAIIGRSAVDFILKMVGSVGSPPTCTLNPATTVYTVSAGQNVSFTVTGSDPDVGQTVTINTGGVPPGATMTPGLPLTGASPQTSTFSFTPTVAQRGAAFVVSFTVTDNTGRATPCSVTINVLLNQPPTVSAGGPYSGDEGAAIALTGTVTDPDGPSSTLLWTYTAGAGVDAGATCTFSAPTALATDITCTDDGTFIVTLTANDGLNPAVSASADVNVANVAPVITGISTPTDGQLFPVGTPVSLSASFTDAGTNDTHTCSIDWNDGITSGTVAELSGSGTCTGSHSFASSGVYTIQVTVTDDDDGTDTATVMVTVNNPPTVSLFGPYSGDEGAAIALAGTVTDPDGPSSTLLWTYTAGAGVDAGATCSFSAPTALATDITCTDDGTFIVTLTANDGLNPAVSASADVNVANVAPVITGISTPTVGQLFPVGTPVNLSASFTDAGTNDTHLCSINWDDGTTPGTVAELSGSGTCTGTHSFASAGVYTILVTVTDDDDGTDTEEVMVVVFDPSAGFVTGGGWISSPTGAYSADPSLTGRANFGFVAKYHHGATTPSGNTEFQFRAASFNFHSDSYEWLVVAGAKAQFKGEGSVNGVSGYKFILTATDGNLLGGGDLSPDRFRIKIFSAGGGVVYDNAVGASDDIDAANPQALGAGSIVIHR